MESALSELKKETGLSEDEIKDLTNETDVSQVLDQYKSNADKAMVLFMFHTVISRLNSVKFQNFSFEPKFASFERKSQNDNG